MTTDVTIRPHVVFAYHGCDQDVAEHILRGAEMTPAQNPYDWLGTGYYFWEADPSRAMKWAVEARERHRTDGVKRAPDKVVRSPFVLGAVIKYGHCRF